MSIPLVIAALIGLALLSSACGTASRPVLDTTGEDRQTPTSVLVIETDPDGDPGSLGGSPPEYRADGSSARATADGPNRAPGSGAGAPLVLLDTDMGPDIDDALALAALHTYQDRGQAEIAAVTLSRNSELGARFIDAMNTWYGHPDVPVGIDRRSPYAFIESDTYVTLADRWPNDVARAPLPDGVTVLRRALARAIEEGRDAVLIQVGFSGNTAALLDSGPDDISPLAGPELVTESGALLSVMAGSIDNPRIEFNVANDVASARRVIEGWPGDLVLSPYELGHDIHYPYSAIRQRLADDGTDLVREAYEFSDYDWHVDAPPLYDMRAWDITSVIHGIEPDGGWFPLSPTGTVTIDAEGRTGFRAGSGRHRVLMRASMSDAQVADVEDRMVDLVSASSP